MQGKASLATYDAQTECHLAHSNGHTGGDHGDRRHWRPKFARRKSNRGRRQRGFVETGVAPECYRLLGGGGGGFGVPVVS
jgi:hypothetical protein